MPARLSEFELIGKIARAAGARHARVPLGIGDDAALVRPKPGFDLVAAADAQVEGVHFRRRRLKSAAIGWKALAVNLSDLAAMGAAPLACLSSVAAPASWSGEELLKIHQGIVACGRRYGCPLVGGNFSKAPPGSALQIHVTVLGEVGKGRALLRAGAGPGDDVWVSGRIGEAHAALRHLQNGGRPGAPSRRHARPEPRLALGSALGAAGRVHACIDVSDGLVADLGHVLESSGNLGAVLDLGEIPLAGAARRALAQGGLAGVSPYLSGGEDYELLFCAPGSARRAVLAAARRARTKVARIGWIEKTPGVRLALPTGEIVPWRGAGGWRHW